MIKKLVLVFIACFAIQSYAQEGTASPYSYYGIGSLKFKGTVENRSMGGIGVYVDSIHVNLQNPASYGGTNIDAYNNESRPVTFSVGGGHTSTKLKSDSGSNDVSSSTFDYLAISIPVGKLGFGFGLLPYTSVGYELENYNGRDNIESRFNGEGGVNKTYLSAGYQLTKSLSVGVDMQYNFGNIKGNTIGFVYDNANPDELVQYQTQEDNRSDLSGLSFNLGLSHKTKIADKLELMSSFTYSPKANLKSKNQRTFNTIVINSLGDEFVVNTAEADLEAEGLKETDLTLPFNLSVGTGIGQPNRWFVGAEYSLKNTSNFSNDLYSSNTTVYENASAFALGGFYIPQYNSYSSYLKRIVYRAGIRVEETGLNINDEHIKEFGISFGVGLPVGNMFSNANLGFEIGNRGTTKQNLIKENFVNFHLSLSLNDRWFKKVKYD